MKYIEILFVATLCLGVLTRGNVIGPENPYYKNADSSDTDDSADSDSQPPSSDVGPSPPNGDSSGGTPSKPGESDDGTEDKTSESGGGSVTTVTTTSKGTSLSLVFPLLTLLPSLSFIFSNS
ncbi:unnamed protein product [Hymenolepis diminuta]|uniref:Uncharacterized protein n=1 Tax=Hymenolepis diminuta TaxID=6216 RepID=A0A564XYD6_HYMDI|nr:unnamed protein product [Hymenolepis diminuta]